MSYSAKNAGNNPMNNEVLPASLMAAALLAVAILASTLAAQPPVRSGADQDAPEPVINNADSAAIANDVEAPIYGLTLEQRSNGRVFVAAVEPASRPWKAGFREGDYLVAVGDLKGVPYDKFLEGLRNVAATKYEGDKFNVTILRDGRRHVLEVPGAGRSPEDLRKLQKRSEKAIDEKLESDEPVPSDYESSLASTADIEEYLTLARRSQEEELSVRDQRRFGQLASVVVGGGWLGGGGVYDDGAYGDDGVAAAPSRSNWYRPGADGQPVDAFGDAAANGDTASTAASSGAQVPESGVGSDAAPGLATPGTGIGDGQPAAGASQASRLGAEMRRLEQIQAAGGRLNGAQTQRLAALRQLSQFAGAQGANGVAQPGINGAAAGPGRMSPEQLQGLQRAYQSGTMTPAQRQSLLQLQRSQLMSDFARSGPGMNRNMPAGAAQGGNLNVPGGLNPGAGVNPGIGGNAGAGILGTGGVQGAGAANAGASGVGVQGAGSGIGDAN